MNDFEKKVFNNLKECGVSFEGKKASLGLAVSGGADSVSLLVSLSSIAREYSLSLKVCTVNHRIRCDEESSADVKFVEELCRKLSKELEAGAGRTSYETCVDRTTDERGTEDFCEGGTLPSIELFKKDIPEGEVFRLSKIRKCGTEEAARFLRYKAFEEFKEKFNLDYVLLAHNRNDNLETVLMRFLQGAVSSGIRMARGFYLRPLLTIERSEIESYLTEKEIFWRNDSTNKDESYLRNRIRLSLIPLLDEKFPGWKKSVEAGAEKVFHDENFISNSLKKNLPNPLEKTEEKIVYKKEDLSILSYSELTRLFFDSFSYLKIQERIPYNRVSEVVEELLKEAPSPSDSFIENGKKLSSGAEQFFEKEENLSSGTVSFPFEVSMKNVTFGFDKKTVYVKKCALVATSSDFFAIIEKTGDFDFPFGILSVRNDDSDANTFVLDFGFCKLSKTKLPVLVRNVQNADLFEASDGSFKKAKDILSSFHVPKEERKNIPVVQDLTDSSLPMKALLGSFCGCKDWIVKNR